MRRRTRGGRGPEPGPLETAILRAAMRILPPAFRERFADGIHDTVTEGLRERRRAARTRFLLRSALGIVVAGLRERFAPTLATDSSLLPRTGLMDVVTQELRFALRALRRRPAFATLVVVTLALGIGATTAVFSVVDGVLLRPLPYPDPDELVMVWAYDSQSEPVRGSMSPDDVESLRGVSGLEAVEGWSSTTATLTGGAAPVRIEGARTTGSLGAVMGREPVLGRDLRHADDVPEGPRVVVVSHAFWLERFGGDREVLGRTLELDEVAHEIVGVMPPGFDYPDGAAFWVPARVDPAGCGRGCHIYQTVARVADGVSATRLDEEMEGLRASLAEAFPGTNRFKAFDLEPLTDYVVGDVRTGLWVLLGAVAAVLLIACANVANLLLVRSSARTTEVAVRSALGASPRRMLGGILAESAVLAALGGVLGFGLARAMVALFRRVPAGTVPRMGEVAVDGGVLAFGVAVTVLVTLLFGLAPALGLARTPAGRSLGGAARSGHRRESRSRSLLLAGEVGLSVVLLAGAGLFLRSLAALHGVDLGFDRTEVVRFTLDLPEARYAELGEIADFYRRLEERLADVPGVEAVGSAWDPPLGSGRIYGTVVVAGRPDPAPGEETSSSIRPMTPGFFDALGLRLLEGRGIEATDVEGSGGVAVVNETFVRENFPGEDPLGRMFRVTANFGWGPPDGFRIVGIVGDVRRTPTADPAPAIYVPHAQFGPERLSVHLRGRADAGTLVAAARTIVGEMDPNLPLSRVETLGDAMARATGTTRFYLSLVGGFALLAVVLTGVGLFGVVSFLVARRTREIGVRVALGAGTARVRTMVLAQGLVPAMWGLAVGVLVTVLAGRVLESLLFVVGPRDPWVLLGVVVLLGALTVVATLLPARRATRVDPVVALRAE